MNGFLLDTNCISELVRVRPDANVCRWIDSIDEQILFISVLTLGEIRRGIALLDQGRKRSQLEAWLETSLKIRFGNRILPIDENVADRWGLLSAEAKKKGKVLATTDGLLAATAHHHNLTIATRNVSDFSPAKIPVINPWE